MWKPIITDTVLKKSIQEKISEISFVLNSNEILNPENTGLLSGQSGILLFKAYHDLYTQSVNGNNIEKSILNIFSGVNTKGGLSYSNGMCGVLWALNHLVDLELLDIDEDFFEETTSAIQDDLVVNSNTNNYDYLHGAFGQIHYLLGRKQKFDRKIIDNVLKKYAETSETIDDKMCRKILLNFDTRKIGYCLGLAHGVPGVILILVNYLKLFPNDILARDILLKNLNFLISTKKDKPDPYYFPTCIVEDYKDYGKLGWCYGDLGCALAIFKAGKLLHRNDLVEEAISLFMLLTTCKGTKEQYITDADFCHGTVGIAHFFNRMYNWTDINEFKIASEYWYSETMNLAKFTDGLAGFKHFNGLKKDFVCQQGFLEGVAGIGLSLMASISHIEPKWDRSLLLD